MGNTRRIVTVAVGLVAAAGIAVGAASAANASDLGNGVVHDATKDTGKTVVNTVSKDGVPHDLTKTATKTADKATKHL